MEYETAMVSEPGGQQETEALADNIDMTADMNEIFSACLMWRKILLFLMKSSGDYLLLVLNTSGESF